MTELKKQRLNSRMTQQEAARMAGISLRSYISYENDEAKSGTLKYRYLLNEMSNYCRVDEEHGILKIEEIKKICREIMKDYSVQYCYLFGSYAKGNASPASDIDLLIETETTGLRYYELVEKLREQLHKKIDLLDTRQLAGNEKLLNEVLKDGIKIYG